MNLLFFIDIVFGVIFGILIGIGTGSICLGIAGTLYYLKDWL